MLKLRISSDWHMEMLADRQHKISKVMDKFVLPPLDTDAESILMMAGDCGSMHYPSVYARVMDHVAPRFKAVIMCPGNHDYWGTDLKGGVVAINNLIKNHKNIYFDNFEFLPFNMFGDDRPNNFVFTTLWTDFNRGNPLDLQIAANGMNDYRHIGSLEAPSIKTTPEQLLVVNKVMAEQLFKVLQPNDVVMTHHLPSYRSVDPRMVSSPLNSCYASEYDLQIIEKKPALWIHGHTHSSHDYRIGLAEPVQTRVVCNPYGYHAHDTNKQYIPDLVIDV